MFAKVPNLHVLRGVPLDCYTRFAIGGPADTLVETSSPESLAAALGVVHRNRVPHVVIGGGTNLIVSDEGFRGVVLRFTASSIQVQENSVVADSGAKLSDLVDFAVGHGLKGLETLAGIPGWAGGAIYGNAGAYGHSISECLSRVRFFDGNEIREFTREQCEFRYRESIFKRRKDWIILSAELDLAPWDAAELRNTAHEIVTVRNRKFPPTMKCAGSIFKNFLIAELPPSVAARVPAEVIREGKVPAAYFLERVGAKGMARGDIRVADYHANLVFNAGSGCAADLCALIGELKRRVRAEFGMDVEEEVQYVGELRCSNQ